MIGEENLREREMALLNKKYAMESQMSRKCDEKLENKYKITMQHLENQREKFLSELTKVHAIASFSYIYVILFSFSE